MQLEEVKARLKGKFEVRTGEGSEKLYLSRLKDGADEVMSRVDVCLNPETQDVINPGQVIDAFMREARKYLSISDPEKRHTLITIAQELKCELKHPFQTGP